MFYTRAFKANLCLWIRGRDATYFISGICEEHCVVISLKLLHLHLRQINDISQIIYSDAGYAQM